MKILISTASFGEHDHGSIEALKQAGYDIKLNPYKRKLSETELIQLAKDCDGIIAGTESYTKKVFEQLPKLKAISRCGAGMDSVDLEEAKKRKIIVKNTPDAPTQAVAELTIALMLSALRKIPQAIAQTKAGNWKKEMGYLLNGKIVGVIGLGKIGKTVAIILSVFGAKIIAVEPNPDKEFIKKNNIRIVSIRELMQGSDIVTLHIPYTKENRNLINTGIIKIMKKGAIIVNTSRGGLVEENAVYDAIKEGHLGGAAFDVMDKEPYNGPLKELNNVIITPHIGSYAKESRIRMENEAAKNIVEVLGEEK